KLQNLGYVFAEEAQLATAIGAAILLWVMLNDLAWKMRGQRLARWSGLGSWLGLCGGSFGIFFSSSLLRLRLFQLQLELLNLNGYLFALGAKDHATELFDDQLQMFDLLRLRSKRLHMQFMPLDDQRLQGFDIEQIEVRKNT